MRLAFVFSLLCILPCFANADTFSQYWYDGKAEMSGYELTISRYGQTRQGACVMIFVTEPFHKEKLVKVDDHTRDPGQTANVLKLNLVRDFQTGIYDYNTMTSVFSWVTDLSPAKITFSSAEWCGHVYAELGFREKEISGPYFSYFEDETGRLEIDRKKGGVAEDNLFILLRGLKGEYLAAGEKRAVSLLPSLFTTRLAHQDLAWTSAEISRRSKNEKINVPAGSFDTIVYEVAVSDGRKGVYYVESEYPHRIIRWEMLPDVRGELTGSERLEYWQLNREGDESYLKKLGL